MKTSGADVFSSKKKRRKTSKGDDILPSPLRLVRPRVNGHFELEGESFLGKQLFF